jgi:hypothetical protein
MADDFTVTVEGVDQLVAALTRAQIQAEPRVFDVVSRGALGIKRDWQQRWSGLSHAPALPRAISYETRRSLAGISAEIGPDKGKAQGALGNLVEFGSVNNAPRPGGLPALEAEAPRFEKALGDMLGGLLDD